MTGSNHPVPGNSRPGRTAPSPLPDGSQVMHATRYGGDDRGKERADGDLAADARLGLASARYGDGIRGPRLGDDAPRARFVSGPGASDPSEMSRSRRAGRGSAGVGDLGS